MKREVVVHHDALPKAVNEQPDPVVGVRTDVCGLEESLDDKGELANRGNGR